jgi:hypothetical protein
MLGCLMSDVRETYVSARYFFSIYVDAETAQSFLFGEVDDGSDVIQVDKITYKKKMVNFKGKKGLRENCTRQIVLPILS